MPNEQQIEQGRVIATKLMHPEGGADTVALLRRAGFDPDVIEAAVAATLDTCSQRQAIGLILYPALAIGLGIELAATYIDQD